MLQKHIELATRVVCMSRGVNGCELVRFIERLGRNLHINTLFFYFISKICMPETVHVTICNMMHSISWAACTKCSYQSQLGVQCPFCFSIVSTVVMNASTIYVNENVATVPICVVLTTGIASTTISITMATTSGTAMARKLLIPCCVVGKHVILLFFWLMSQTMWRVCKRF